MDRYYVTDLTSDDNYFMVFIHAGCSMWPILRRQRRYSIPYGQYFPYPQRCSGRILFSAAAPLHRRTAQSIIDLNQCLGHLTSILLSPVLLVKFWPSE
jgi:hypothetical protein